MTVRALAGSDCCICHARMQAEDDIDDKEVGITATKETELLNTSQRTAMV